MSFLVQALQGFAGLGAVATIPLTLVFTHKPIEIKAITRLVPPPAPQEEKQAPVEIIDQMLQIMAKDQPSRPADTKKELDKRGYFALDGSRWNELFVFIDINATESPIFFHYDWRARIVKRITKIVYKSATSAQLIFQDGFERELKYPKKWMHEWRGTDLVAERDCTFSKKDITKNLYKFTCNKPIEKPWEQIVSIVDITLAKKTANNSR